jgi:acyl-ACP thioesterase
MKFSEVVLFPIFRQIFQRSENMNVWQETLSVDFTAVDPSDRLTLAGTFDLFQEAAGRHAEALGVGRENMANTKQGWVLSRISVLMEKRPGQLKPITVRTWPRGWEHLFALRDFDILDSTGSVLVRGRSAWLILDIEKRRPLRPQAVMEKLPLNEGKDSLPDGAAGLETRDGLEKTGERRAAYSDIDYNGHVNNARYVQWIQDITDPTLLEQAHSIRLDINYLREVKIDETVEFFTVLLTEPGRTKTWAEAIEGRRPEDGTAVFRAELRLTL